MKINRNILLKVSLATGLTLVLIGAFLKISHFKGADALMIIGLIITLIYTFTEISTNYNNQIKIQTPKIFRDTLLNISFAVGFSISIYAAYLKTFHLHGSVVLLVIGGLSTLIFILIALNEIFSSTRINKSEKIMWTICLILLSSISGFVYL
jgi:hypothetical protein